MDDLQQQLHSMICSSVLIFVNSIQYKKYSVNAFKIPEFFLKYE